MSSRGNQDHHGLRWSLGTIVYQFIGSGPYLYLDVVDAKNPSGYLPRGYGVSIEVKGTEFITKPLYSNIEEDTENPKRWDYFYSWYRLVDNQFQLRVKPAHQPDGQGIQQWFSDKKNWLLTTWGQSHPCSGIGSLGYGETIYSVDRSYDYSPVLFSSTSGRFYEIPANWWRSGSIQVVDNQSYLIFVDVDNLFYAVPLSDITNKKTGAAPWPAWLTLATLGEESGQTEAEYLASVNPAWKFNHTGTRAACVVAHRNDPWSDGSYTSSIYASNGSYIRDLQHDTPAMVEVDLTITPSGSDFLFTVTSRQAINSLDEDDVPIAVDYAMGVTGITDDSLVLMVFEHYVNPLSMASFDSTYSRNYAYHPNKVTLCHIKTQLPTGFAWVNQRTFLAYYVSWDNTFNQTRLFTPQFIDYPEVDPDLIEGVYKSNFCFITQIGSIELSSLSLVMCATAWTENAYKFYIDKPNNGVQWRYAYNEAYSTQVIAFNTIKTTLKEVGGYPPLSAVLDGMLNREVGSHPSLTGYSLFPIASTIAYRTQSGSDYGAVNVVVDNGSETITQTVSACEHTAKSGGGGGFANITYCSLFTAQSFVAIPQHFLFFDSVPSVRPGITFNLATPTLFEDYPAGLVHHENIHALVMNAVSQVKGRIRTHPSGSFSLFFGPMAANKNLITFINGVSDIANDYDQAIIDHLFFKFKDNELITNHISTLATAFGKTWTKPDYYFHLSINAGTIYIDPQVTTYPASYAYPLRNPTQYYTYPMGVSHAAFNFQILNDYGNIGYYTIQQSSATLHSYFADETPNPAQEAVFHFGKKYKVE